MSVRVFQGAEHYQLHELVNLGRRLSETQLNGMGLMEAVVEAEREYFWRLRAASELLGDLGDQLAPDLVKELAAADKQVNDPKRGPTRSSGSSPRTGGRRLPPAGSLLVVKHLFNWSTAPALEVNGQKQKKRSRTFRFAVVAERGKVIGLDDPSGPIFNNPTGASSWVTEGTVNNGWAFFGAN